MPHTASLTRNRSRQAASDSIPRGYSIANRDLANQIITSLLGFYGASEVLSLYSPQFPVDNASIVERIVKEVLKDTLAKLKNLLTLKPGWNGYDSLAPNPDAVLHAENWIGRLFLEVADLGRPWIKPNVIADANGDVVFEWWHGKKKLTVYIEAESAEYVQVWGTNIHSEMSNGDAEPISTCRALWLWLTS
jgi:hypothetical protein